MLMLLTSWEVVFCFDCLVRNIKWWWSMVFWGIGLLLTNAYFTKKCFYPREYALKIFFLITNFVKKLLCTGLILNYMNKIMIYYLHLLPLPLLQLVRHHEDQNENLSSHCLNLLYLLWLLDRKFNCRLDNTSDHHAVLALPNTRCQLLLLTHLFSKIIISS